MADMIRTKLEKSLSVSSLDDLVRVQTASDVWLMLDASGSMKDSMRNGKRKITGLRQVVGEISQGRTVKMIAFGSGGPGRYNDDPGSAAAPDILGNAWVTTHVPDPMGGTPLHDAISLARKVGASRTILISDGCPNDPARALEEAKAFGGRIDVVYVGDPNDRGEQFLRELAKATGGTEFHGDLSEPKKLGSQIVGLLESGDAEDQED